MMSVAGWTRQSNFTYLCKSENVISSDIRCWWWISRSWRSLSLATSWWSVNFSFSATNSASAFSYASMMALMEWNFYCHPKDESHECPNSYQFFDKVFSFSVSRFTRISWVASYSSIFFRIFSSAYLWTRHTSIKQGTTLNEVRVGHLLEFDFFIVHCHTTRNVGPRTNKQTKNNSSEITWDSVRETAV